MRKVGIWSVTLDDGPQRKIGCEGYSMDDGQQGMDGNRRPVESTRDPRTYHCVDSRHETCGAWTYSSMDSLHGGTCGHSLEHARWAWVPVTMWGSAGTKVGRSDSCGREL